MRYMGQTNSLKISTGSFVQTICFVTYLFVLSACDLKMLNGQLVGRVQTEPQGSIAGKIETTSLTSLSSCQPTTVQLIEVGATGEEIVAQEVSVGPDNTYKFLGVQLAQGTQEMKYLVRALGCREAVQRIVTGSLQQDINAVTSLIAFATRAENFSRSQTNTNLIQSLYKHLAGSSLSQVYSEITSNSDRLAQFQSALSVPPVELESATPIVVRAAVTRNLQEGVTATIELDTYHWASSFSDAVDWILDGQTVSHLKSFSWTPGANDQGRRNLVARIGKNNGAGAVDTSIRFKTVSYALDVENSILPSVPAISLLSASPTSQLNLDIQISTGASLSNCASFSSLKFVVDTPIAPLTHEAFDIACTTAPSQTVSLTVPSGDGLRRIYLWTKDSSGVVSSSAQFVDVVIDTTPPNPTLVLNRNYSSSSLGVSGVCETGLTVLLTGDFSESPLNIPCVSGVYSQTLTPSGADGSKTVTVAQTDAVGLAGSQSASYIKDTVAPSLSLSSPTTSSIVSQNVSVSGTCTISSAQSTSIEIVVGTLTDSTNCVAGAFSKTVNIGSLADGSLSIFARQTDYAGNVGVSTSVSFVKDTVAPVFEYSLSSVYKGGQSSSLEINLTEEHPLAAQSLRVFVDVGSGFNQVGQSVLTETPYTNQSVSVNASFPSVNSSTARLKIALVDAAGNSRESIVDPITIDSLAPEVTTFVFNSNLSAASQSNISFGLTATDNLSKVSSICLKKTSSAPAANDDCWAPVSAYGQILSNSVNISSFYNVGLSSGSFIVYAFAKDQAGWISSLSASGAGTPEIDRSENIIFTAPQPPKIVAFEVTSTDVPSSPASTVDLTAASGSALFLRWKISSAVGLSATPIEIRYSIDEANYNVVLASSLLNSANGSCTIPSGYTGCAQLTSPLSSFYRLRLKVTDQLGFASLAPANPMNSGNFKVLSGNTDLGLGGSALSAVLRPVGNAALAVLNDGRIFILDERGLMMVAPQTGNLELLIPDGAEAVGNGVPVSSAQLRNVNHILVDKDQNLILFDEVFVRKVNTQSNPMTIQNIIGGGGNSSDSSIPAADLAYSWANQAYTLPNGDIVFRMNGEKKVRWYKASDQTVSTLIHSGLGNSFSDTQESSTCTMESFFPITNSAGEMSEYVVRSESTKDYITGNLGPCGYAHTGEWKTYSRHNVLTGLSALPAPITINTNAESQNTLTGYREFYRYYSSLRGDIYAAQSGYGLFNRIAKFNKTTLNWTVVLGDGTPGSCADNTLASACAVSPHSVAINSQGQIFYIDDFSKSVRTLDSNNRIVTIVGDKLGSDDGTPAHLARYNALTDLATHSDSGTKIITLIDYYDSRIRQFASGGAVTTVAGTQRCADADISQPASTQPIYTCADGNPHRLFVETNGDIFYTGRSSQLMKLNRATNFWDTPISSQLYVGPQILAARSDEFLLAWIDLEPGRVSYKAYNRTTKVSTRILGKDEPGASFRTSATYCADGESPLNCNPGNHDNGDARGQYDATTGKYVMAEQSATGRIVLISPDGSTPIQTLATMPRAVRGFYLDRASSPSRILYCGDDGVLHGYNLSNGASTDYYLSVPGYGCTGPMVYDSAAGVLTFVMSQNGLHAIGELSGLN